MVRFLRKKTDGSYIFPVIEDISFVSLGDMEKIDVEIDRRSRSRIRYRIKD